MWHPPCSEWSVNGVQLKSTMDKASWKNKLSCWNEPWTSWTYLACHTKEWVCVIALIVPLNRIIYSDNWIVVCLPFLALWTNWAHNRSCSIPSITTSYLHSSYCCDCALCVPEPCGILPFIRAEPPGSKVTLWYHSLFQRWSDWWCVQHQCSLGSSQQSDTGSAGNLALQ